jgi:hypothetical protein
MSIDESRVLHEVAVHDSQGVRFAVDLLERPLEMLVGIGLLHLGPIAPKVLLRLAAGERQQLSRGEARVDLMLVKARVLVSLKG